METIGHILWRIGAGFELCEYAWHDWLFLMKDWKDDKIRDNQAKMFWRALDQNCRYPHWKGNIQ